MDKKNFNTGRKNQGNIKVIEVDSPYLPRYVPGACYSSDHKPRRDFRACCEKDHLENSETKPRQIFKPLPKREGTILYYRLTEEEQDKINGK